MATVKSNSSLTFVYPVTLDGDNFDKLVGAIDAVEISDGNLKIWKPDEFPHDELLPHVADYLHSKGDQPATARLWEMTNETLDSPKGLGKKANWRLVIGKDRELPFKFECVSLFMFRVGVGFLAFRICPESGDLNEWLDFLHYFRNIKSKTCHLTARRKTGKDSDENFFPPVAVPSSEDSEKGTLSQVIHGLLGIIGDKADLPENWWNEIFIHNQMLGYGALFVEGISENEDFNLIYKLRNFFQGEKDIYPSTFDLSPNHPSLLEYGRRQWFIFSLDGGSFLACDPTDNQFFNQTLPDHIQYQYFHLYIIALHQRFVLMSMSHEVAGKWLANDEDEKIAAFERIRDRFLVFTARGYFAQVMQREHHHRCYRRWQEVFELQRIYDDVREEVREMFEWLHLNRAKRIEKVAEEQAGLFEEAQQRTADFERRISLFGLLITFGIGIPALVAGFFGMNIAAPAPTDDFKISLMSAVLWFFGAIILSVTVALGIFIYTNRRQKSDNDNTSDADI